MTSLPNPPQTEFTESGIKFHFVVPPSFHDRRDSVPAGYKSVDFVFEFDNEIILVEVKSYAAVRGKNRGKFVDPGPGSWSLRDKLIYKFRDTLLWRYFSGDCQEKRDRKIVYVALVKDLRPDAYIGLKKSIQSELPAVSYPRRKACFCRELYFLDMKKWNDLFGRKLGTATFK